MANDTICKKCNAVINGRIIKALGNSYHPEHFQCRECSEPITEAKFNQKEGEPVCSKCYLEKFTDICYACKQPINETVVRAMGQTWHADHFVCCGPCTKPLNGGTFMEKDGKPYCTEDYNQLFAKRCCSCKNPITEKAIIALDAEWHKDCFKCNRCKEVITSNTFAVEDNKPVCTKCSG